MEQLPNFLVYLTRVGGQCTRPSDGQCTGPRPSGGQCSDLGLVSVQDPDLVVVSVQTWGW